MSEPTLRRKPIPIRTDRWGVQSGYRDALGGWHRTLFRSQQAVRQAMGMSADDARSATAQPPGTRVVRQGRRVRLGPGTLRLEDGGELRTTSTGMLPREVPLGYHQFQPDDGPAQRLIVAPERAYLPADLFTWGWAVQLYAARSRQSWGMGDFRDLRQLTTWSAADLGAGMLLVNPLGATTPSLPQTASPYYPSSRRFRNPLYLAIEDVPGAAEVADLEPLARAGHALNTERRIDRDAVFRLKMQALDQLWQRFTGDPSFDAYQAEMGQALQDFATFCVLAEQHGAGWQRWPEAVRHPNNAAVSQFRAENARRVGFHAWLQWLLDQQLARAAQPLALVQDLPIGVDPGGADAWAWQDVLAQGVSVGVPPDEFNTLGQDWGLPPFIPHRLRDVGYEPFVQTIRACVRHAGGLRIDHVMGLFRLYWIPRGASAAFGAFVRYPFEDLLGILALESVRAGAWVVGEDLGTVEPVVREQLASHAVLSYRLLWFEDSPPEQFPELALSAITTHDLPTVVGLWNGTDLETQRQLGLHPNEQGTLGIRDHLRQAGKVANAAEPPEVVARAHALLARTPSRIITATLDDALAVPDRPNMPGTVDSYPNWSLALPSPLETVLADPLVHQVAITLAQRPRPTA